MKISPFAVAVVAVAIGLFLSRTRETFTQLEAKCPDGSTPKFNESYLFHCPGTETVAPVDGSCPNGYITESTRGVPTSCRKYTTPKCGEGSILYMTFKPDFSMGKPLCVAPSTRVYDPHPEDKAAAEKTRPPDLTKMCKPGDIFGGPLDRSKGGPKCIAASAAPPANPPPPTSAPPVQPHSSTQGSSAGFPSTAAVARGLEEVNQSLKPFRPPTAPSSDLEKERKAILAISQKDMFFIQIALFLGVLSLLGYIVLPTDYAHGLALLFLSVAISFGFFLRK